MGTGDTKADSFLSVLDKAWLDDKDLVLERYEDDGEEYWALLDFESHDIEYARANSLEVLRDYCEAQNGNWPDACKNAIVRGSIAGPSARVTGPEFFAHVQDCFCVTADGAVFVNADVADWRSRKARKAINNANELGYGDALTFRVAAKLRQLGDCTGAEWRIAVLAEQVAQEVGRGLILAWMGEDVSRADLLNTAGNVGDLTDRAECAYATAAIGVGRKLLDAYNQLHPYK